MHPSSKTDNLTSSLKRNLNTNSSNNNVTDNSQNNQNTNRIPTDPRYKSELTEKEVSDYYVIYIIKKNWTVFKNTFEKQDDLLKNFFIPFQIEQPEYRKAILKTGVMFFGLAIIVFVFIICFFILRLGFKKCTGPSSIKQITRGYRNVSWILFGKYLLI